MPRSFLIKKMTDKFTRAANESKKGQMNDLGGKCVSNIAGGTKPESVQETSRLQLWNGLGTPYIYPAEVTSNYTQVLSGNSSPQRETELKTEDYIDEESENVSNDFPEKRSSGSARVKHKCIECHRSFSTVSGLHKHKQFHCPSPHSRKEFTCKYCDKIYVSLGALKMHIRTHTLPCQCKICGKAFSRPWLLQGHIRTHTGEKPYQCPNCQRAFADRSNLRAHLQTHSTVKKYSCSECSRSFSRMSLLLKHQYSCGTGSDLS